MAIVQNNKKSKLGGRLPITQYYIDGNKKADEKTQKLYPSELNNSKIIM